MINIDSVSLLCGLLVSVIGMGGFLIGYCYIESKALQEAHLSFARISSKRFGDAPSEEAQGLNQLMLELRKPEGSRISVASKLVELIATIPAEQTG